MLKLNQFDICSACHGGSLFRWTISKAMVLRSRRECNNEYGGSSEMTTEIRLCVYLPHCILEPNQCNIEESKKHRIGWLKVDERTIRMEIVV